MISEATIGRILMTAMVAEMASYLSLKVSNGSIEDLSIKGLKVSNRSIEDLSIKGAMIL